MSLRSWECVNQKCIPTWYTDGSASRLQSLMTCNMLCSRQAPLWPHPTGSLNLADSVVPVRAEYFNLTIVSIPSIEVKDHVRDAFELFTKDLKERQGPNYHKENFHRVIVKMKINSKGEKDPRLLVNTDESYALFINTKGNTVLVDIRAESFCGARHGLETLSQLVWYDPLIRSLYAIQAASVEDKPRFAYRGLMLDTSHHFFPLEDLIRTIDAMGSCKLNTFHWHISDSKSFPLYLRSVPQLGDYGAYGHNAMYSEMEIRALVRRARLRGIRVVIEVDAPAHVGRAWSWGLQSGYGLLAHCVDRDPFIDNCDPPCGQLNPRNPHVYELLERIYNELMALTGVTDVFHLGGDDVSESCWAENFKDTNPEELWVQFAQNVLINLSAKQPLPNLTIIWSTKWSNLIKVHLKQFMPHIGLQARGPTWSEKLVRGMRMIASHEDVWDLNTGLGKWFEEVDGAPYNSWQQAYEHRPWGNVEERWIGGEATVWAASPGMLESILWPRAAALAERLWADRVEAASRSVHARLDIHIERMRVRGVMSAPLWSLWCTQNPYSCG